MPLPLSSSITPTFSPSSSTTSSISILEPIDTYIHTNVSSSVSNSSTTAVSEITSSVINNTQTKCKNPRYRGLIPIKKGQILNPRGMKKGTLSIKPILRKKLKKEALGLIADNIISSSIAGHDRKQDRLLHLIGDLGPAENAYNNTNYNNTILLDKDMINSMKLFLEEKYKYSVIDTSAVVSLPISASI